MCIFVGVKAFGLVFRLLFSYTVLLDEVFV